MIKEKSQKRIFLPTFDIFHKNRVHGSGRNFGFINQPARYQTLMDDGKFSIIIAELILITATVGAVGHCLITEPVEEK